jgi:hypothetical protein
MSDRILVASRKGLFTIRRTHGRFSVAQVNNLGDSFTAVLRDPRSGFILAASKHDHFGPRLFRSVDDGRTFEPTGLPTYPPKPEGTKDVEPMGGREVPWALKSIWCLETGHASEPGVLWCGTLPGGLFKSTDDGATWELNRPL